VLFTDFHSLYKIFKKEVLDPSPPCGEGSKTSLMRVYLFSKISNFYKISAAMKGMVNTDKTVVKNTAEEASSVSSPN